MPVGTYGTVKAMSPANSTRRRADRPRQHLPPLAAAGLEVIEAHRGLHGSWAGTALLTDSGGFQVFSLGADAQGQRGGRALPSPVNGDKLLLTPEESMRIQRTLDSDIAMIFDECTPYPATGRRRRRRCELSLRWAAARARAR
jgi:queuine tRNA-ribosyltransferase